MSDLRYPIERFAADADVTEEKRRRWIGEIANTPDTLRAAVHGLSAEQLDTPYRPGGWTVRQVVHHLPDSHLNAYVRFKLALTEREPTVKTYDEAIKIQKKAISLRPGDEFLQKQLKKFETAKRAGRRP